ncbi:hypothetical protein [Synechococcus sp. CB0101]|uniref:hypothetical protein n=1 Tax=Synechococcus sp. CB0101 TaxID=232348 RepID=UPI00030D2B98|nr:hypothetical protein [Synechococcus sp. CB0101]
MVSQLVDGPEMTGAATRVRVHHHHVPAERRYRLIDGCCEPHAQLDGEYQSIDEAIGEAINWLLASTGGDEQSWIGVEVCTGNGDWRTCRLPMPLLCELRAGPTS